MEKSPLNLGDIHFSPLTMENIEAVYKIFEKDEPFYRISLEFFRRGSLNDEGFDADWSLVANVPNGSIIGFVFAVKRNNNAVIKAFLVTNGYRYRGIGTKMIIELFSRIKHKLPKHPKVSFGASPPRYWTPGVDVRHTSLLFFFEKHGFKRKGQRQNLSVDLTRFHQIPKTEKNGYTFARIQPEEVEELISFVAQEHRGSWPLEARMGIENSPPTTFIARNQAKEIIGFASCSVQFPGSFGPTGVKRSLRGGGIGKELLLWCCHSQKELGLKELVIQWVGPIKFYSKCVGAFQSQFFIDMQKKL